MKPKYKYGLIGGVITIAGLVTYYLIWRYGYKRLGTDKDKGLVDTDLEKKLKATDFSQVTYKDYNVNDIPELNDVDISAAYYVTNHGFEHKSKSETKDMLNVNINALTEIKKRKLWKTIWLNDPFFGKGNRDYYNKTGKILGN